MSLFGVFPCRGENLWLAIAVFTDEEWKAFCEVIGNPEWTKDPVFATFVSRKEYEDELEKLIAEWTVNHDRYEIMDKMQAAGVPAMVVQSGRDLYYDPQLKHRHFYRRLDHPAVGTVNYESHAYKLSKTPIEVRRASLIGEHNEFVCKQMLGMPDKEYDELVADGAIETYAHTIELLKKM